MPDTPASSSGLPQTQMNIGRLFLVWLSWVLLCYAFLGRGFAYVGIAPVYIGEITLLRLEGKFAWESVEQGVDDRDEPASILVIKGIFEQVPQVSDEDILELVALAEVETVFGALIARHEQIS